MFFEIDRIFFKNKINLFLSLKNKNDFYRQVFYVSVYKKNIKIELIEENNCQLSLDLKNKDDLRYFFVKKEGSFFINSKSFFAIDKLFDDRSIKNITFSNEEEKNKLLVKSGSREVDFLISEKEDNYPLNFSISEKLSFWIKVDDFKKIIRKTAFAIDKKGDRLILTGVSFEFNNDFIFLTSTDSYRLSRVKYNLPIKMVSDNKIKNNLVIKKDVLDSINKVFEYSKKINFLVSDQFVVCKDESNEKKFKGCLIDEKYPDVERVFPKKENFLTSLRINRIKFLKNLKSAIFILFKNEKEAKISFNDKNLVLVAKNSINDSFKDEINFLNFKGIKQKISLNIKYLEDALNAFDCSEVEINIINEEKPVILSSEQEPGTYQLVLPLRST